MKTTEEIANIVAIILSRAKTWQAEADGDTVKVYGSHGVFHLTVDTEEEEKPRRYEVAGFDRDSVAVMISDEDMAGVEEGHLEAIAQCMRRWYSPRSDADLRNAIAEVLPFVEVII